MPAAFWALCAQLGMLVLLVRNMHVENQAFVDVVTFVFPAFIIHSFLKPRFRLPFFLFVSFSAIFIALGTEAALAVIVIVSAYALLALLPVSTLWRFGIVAFAATIPLWPAVHSIHFIQRTVFLPLRVGAPLVASMLIFRLPLFLLEEKRARQVGKLKALSYFFLFPNVCFPLFPPIGYAAFSNTYYNDEPFRIYQRGIVRILYGVIGIVLSRLVYNYIAIDPAYVRSGSDVLRFLCTGLFLYVRVVAYFDLGVGVLLLFGFNLPRAARSFLFSDGIFDFFQKFSFYWRVLVLRHVFIPVCRRLNGLGRGPAIGLAIFIATVAVYLLHAYQKYWIFDVPIEFRGTDAIFWGGICVFAFCSAFVKPLRKNTSVGMRIVRVAMTFVIVSVLFSIWNSESLDAWLSVVTLRGMS